MSSNPRETLNLKDNTVIVVLGASGDLAHLKTFPALFGLFRQNLLPRNVHVVGYARSELSPEKWDKQRVGNVLKKGPTDDTEFDEKVKQWRELTSYVKGLYDKDDGFIALNKHIEEIESKYPGDARNRVFYFALPPSVFVDVAKGIKKNCYTTKGAVRVIVEKPFGRDTATCRELVKAIGEQFQEEETYRIDHYLGKEMVKNILYFRFANLAFSKAWDNTSISNVQISFKETLGTEGRGGYFDDFGIIRDVIQNHILQVLAVLTMDRPVSFSAKHIQQEKIKVLSFIPPITEQDALLGQYVGDGKGKPSYTDDESLKDKQSTCPTFAALVLWINNERWKGVPFILKAGKALNQAKVEARIQFKDVVTGDDVARNELVIRIQPNEAIYLKVNVKKPGLESLAIPAEMDLTYKRRFQNAKIPEAYEALILDCLHGDRSNFVGDEELYAAWEIFTPLLHKIDQKTLGRPRPYAYGSRGPEELEEFIAQKGYRRKLADKYVWPVTRL